MTIPQTQKRLIKTLNAKRALSCLSLSGAMAEAYTAISTEIEKTHEQLRKMMKCDIVVIECGGNYEDVKDLHDFMSDELPNIFSMQIGNTRIAYFDFDLV